LGWFEKVSAGRGVWLLTGLVALVISTWTAFSAPGSWDDDAYIFFRYAQNFVAGEGLAFNAGETSFGVTSVLWTLVLGAFCWISRLETVAAAKILCVLLLSGSALLLTKLFIRRTQNLLLGLWAGFLTALHPTLLLYAVSGMEVALNLFLLSALAAAYFSEERRKFFGLGILIGLLFLTRPENVVLIPIFAFLAFREQEKIGQKLAGLFIGITLMALPWELYFYFKTSLFLPPTREGKLLLFLPPLYGLNLEQFHQLELFDRFKLAAKVFSAFFQMRSALVFLPFLLLTGYFIGRRKIALTRFWLAGAAYASGLVLLFAFFFPLVKLRYFIHLYPFLIFISVLGIFHLWTLIRNRSRFFGSLFWARAGVAALFLTIPLAGYVSARKYAGEVTKQEVRTEVGQWLKANSPIQARVALEPIGAIGYYSGRYIVDLGGLVQPEVWPYMADGHRSRTDSLLSFLERENVDYLIDYSHHPWAGRVVDSFPEKFILVAQIRSIYSTPLYNSYDIFKIREQR